MDRYLKRRWAKAQAYTTEQVVYEYNDAYGSRCYRVQSSGGGWYLTRVCLQDSKLVYADCHCKDFGETKLRDIPVCKHTLAAAIAAHNNN